MVINVEIKVVNKFFVFINVFENLLFLIGLVVKNKNL